MSDVKAGTQCAGGESTGGPGPWREGLSATSSGRFGGYRGFRQPEQGFLCWSAGSDRILLHDQDDQHGHVLFQLLPERPFGIQETVDWTTQRFAYTDLTSNRPLGEMIHSVLFPGSLLRWQADTLAWWNYELSQSVVAYPSRAGYRVVAARECNYPTFQAKDDHAFAGPWMIVWLGTGNPIPLLFLFEHAPQSVETLSRAQRLHFAQPAGLIGICPLTGCDRWLKASSSTLAKGLDEKLTKLIDTWSRLKLAVPIICRETFRVDRASGDTAGGDSGGASGDTSGGGRIEICQEFDYLRSRDDFGTKPLELAPLPPWLALAHQVEAGGAALGLRVEGDVLDTGIPTLFGPYAGTAGPILRFSIPRSAGIAQTIAPVRITNDPPSAQLCARLDQELAEPTLTFGGDNTYHPDNIQDILHNLRVLAWATWSLPDDRRAQRFAGLTRGLKGFDPSSYVEEKEPVTGLNYLWEKNLWGGGAIAVDLEWYNGMQLAGLWQGLFFSGDEANFLQQVKAHWPIVTGLLRYFEIFHDWVTGLTYTALTRKCLWFDGLNFAWQGQAGAARLAWLAGDHLTADKAEYLAARTSLGRATAWFAIDYALAHHATPISNKVFAGLASVDDTHTPGQRVVSGFLERRGMTTGASYDPGNGIGYLVPEQLILQRLNPRILEMLRRGQYEFLDHDLPTWNIRFHRCPKGRGPEHKHPLYPTHSHFYFLDPQLFVRSILLREPLDKLLGYTAELTGPVMECYLVAHAPMVLYPTQARFRGVRFDAAGRQLVIPIAGEKDQLLSFLVIHAQPPTSVVGAEIWRHDPQAGMAVLQVRVHGKPGQEVLVSYPD
ncbi:MAG: hypothetical protein IT443_03220 [Phycisphaeraceae bacterium]|nr:hypothetical protein [Phycisphaeraceae bacterium]